MRIMHVIESLEQGGAEAVVVDLANACSQDHEVTICCTKKLGDLADRLDPEVALVCLDRGEGNDLTLPWRIAREARHRDIEILHSHAWGVFLETVAAAWLTGRRVVHTVHGPYLKHGSGFSQRARARLRRVAERIAALRVAGIACVAASLREFVTQQMRLPATVTVIHNGIPDYVASSPPPPADDAQRLVSVGRLVSVKAYDVLLRAFAQVSHSRPRLRLTIVGDGPERESLERLAERLCVGSSVDFVGFRDDVPELLAKQNLFVLSSQHEGISIAILEAMRAGLPVVATRVGGVPETVVDGVTGVLVPPDDAPRMAEAIDRLLQCPASLRAIGAAGRAVQRRRFSLTRMREQYVELYGVGAPTPVAIGETSVEHSPLRILYHHRTQGRGAEGVHIASIVQALRSMGHKVTVLGPPGVDALATAGAAPVDKSAVRTRGANSLWKMISRHAPGWMFEFAEIAYNVLAWWRLRQAWRHAEYDLVYERYAFYLVAGARFAARRGVPFVLEANEVNGLEERARRQAMPDLCGRFEAHLLARCDGVLTVSSYLRRRILKRGVHPQRVRVVPNAIGPGMLRQANQRAGQPGALRRRYGLAGKTVIGFAGWFDHWDRLDLLLEAVQRLVPQHPSLVAMLIGDGPVASELADHARTLGVDRHVLFTGAVPRTEMIDHLALLDVAVLPHSNRFGSPVVLFEFMARGLAIVAPRLDPITDVLRDGVTGMLFEPLDLDRMVEAIDAVLESAELRRRLGETARYRVATEHTWARNAAEILSMAGFEPPATPEQVRRAS